MSLSMYQASIPVFVRALRVLSDLLAKAEAQTQSSGLDPVAVIGARLAPDMLPLSGQVQRASDTSKLSAQRLSGVESPRMEDNETTFAQLQARITKTIAYLQSIQEAHLEGSEQRSITISAGTDKLNLSGDDYLLKFAIPNFFFHIATAHGILRNQGVKIGKLDYLGAYDEAH
jgi:hypothetical protein